MSSKRDDQTWDRDVGFHERIDQALACCKPNGFGRACAFFRLGENVFMPNGALEIMATILDDMNRVQSVVSARWRFFSQGPIACFSNRSMIFIGHANKRSGKAAKMI